MKSVRTYRSSATHRRIADLWLAIRTTASVFGVVTIAGIGLSILLSLFIAGGVDPRFILLGVPCAWLFSSWFIAQVWWTYHEGIVIDAENATLSFPATDVEVRLVDVITLKRLFDHGRREALRLASIESVMNETRSRQGRFAVNVSGVFGSRQFSFDSKQKRDEFRAAIDWASRETGVRSRQDSNFDTGGFGG